MKTYWDRLRLSAGTLVALMALPAWCGEIDYFLDPPGSLWGRVLFTNFVSSRAFAIERCHEGFIVAGEVRLPGDTLYDSAVLAVVAEDGTLIRSNVFLGLEYPVWGRLGCGASAVMPSYDSIGQPDGYVVTGYKHQFFIGIPSDPRPEWINPTLWIMKTDLLLQPVWETNIARGVFEYGPGLARWGTGIAQTPDGYLVTGQAYADYLINPFDHDSGTFGLGCMLHLGRDGQVLELREAQQAGNGWLSSGPKSMERTSDGGFFLAIHESVVRFNSSRIPVWTNTQPVWSYDVKERSGGGYVSVGRQRGPDVPVTSYLNTVLASYAAGGDLQWSRVFGRGAVNDIGRSVLESPGSFAMAGQTDSIGAGGKDMWVIKADLGGAGIWDIAMGGPGTDLAYAAALSADARFVVAGEAQIGTHHWMWIVKVMADLHVPHAAFTFQPGNPAFRDQVITFDASASSNPGGSIAAYQWNFGDGTTGTGVTAQHSYPEVGFYDVRLEVLSADGPRSWATQSVEVAGLVMQWQRFYGGSTYGVSGMVEAGDGGFVLAGGTGTSSLLDNHLWVFKVDRRGLPVWEKFYDGPGSEGEYARDLVRGTDGGYVLAGAYGRSANHDALLLKLEEDGEAAWSMKLFGTTNQDEQAHSVAPAADGGYFVVGQNDSIRPLLIKTDPNGNEIWTRHYVMQYGRVGDQILATSDGGAVFHANANGHADWFIKADASGMTVWTNVLPYTAFCYWLGRRQSPGEGFVAAGMCSKDIWLSFLSMDGIASGDRFWSGPAVYQQSDAAYGAALTPDGGYILTGSMMFQEEVWGARHDELFLLKTDAAGDRQWTETFPGTPDRSETGSAILALTNGSYIVLGDDGNSGTPPVWLFKLAANHAPTAVMVLSTNVLAVGEPLLGDAAGSSDRDGSVVGWEWDFGNGQIGAGAEVSYAYTNSGAYVVRLTAVDDQDAERSVTNTVYVSGVHTGSGFTISDSSMTNCPACDPVSYPREGVPLMVDWDNSRGFIISGTATSGSTKTFRVTFRDPVPAGLILYRLPSWTPLACSVVDKHTIEVELWLYAGSYVLPFVLAKAAPLPTIVAFQSVASSRLSLSFVTTAGYRYLVERTGNLTDSAWVEMKHSRNPGDPATLDFLDGSGATETVYLDLPAAGPGFLRIRMQEQ